MPCHLQAAMTKAALQGRRYAMRPTRVQMSVHDGHAQQSAPAGALSNWVGKLNMEDDARIVPGSSAASAAARAAAASTAATLSEAPAWNNGKSISSG